MEPPINSSKHAKVGKPATASPQMIVFKIIQIIYKNAIIQNATPIIDAIDSGIVVNATNPSIEYRSKFQKDHVVSPATLSTFSYGIHFVLNPIQPKIPFEKRL